MTSSPALPRTAASPSTPLTPGDRVAWKAGQGIVASAPARDDDERKFLVAVFDRGEFTGHFASIPERDLQCVPILAAEAPTAGPTPTPPRATTNEESVPLAGGASIRYPTTDTPLAYVRVCDSSGREVLTIPGARWLNSPIRELLTAAAAQANSTTSPDQQKNHS